MLLFDEIAASKNGYDETALKKKFRNEKFIKNFPVIKRYLHEMILKSLNSFYSGSGIENEIKNNLRSIEVLYHKALFKNCAKIINSSLKLAYRTDNFILILDLLRWKKNIIHEGLYNSFQTLEIAHNQEKEIMFKLRNLSDYRLLAYRTQSLAKGNKTDIPGEKIKSELLRLLNNPLLKSEKRVLSYPAAITYHHTRALLFDSLGKNSDAFECRKQLIKVMESHTEKLKLKISNYVIAVYNILGTSLNLKAYNELEYYIKKLRSIEKTLGIKMAENDRMLAIMGSSIFELRMHISRGEFSESFKTLAEIEEELERFNKKIVNDDKLHIFYLLAYGYFGAGKMDTALKWINKILNDKYVINESKLYVKSKLMNLIIHFELGNVELLDYLIKSTYRSLKKNRFSGDDETIVLKFLKQLPKISSQQQISELFAESFDKLKTIPQINNIEFEKEKEFEIQNTFTSSAEFDLMSWLESKITGKSFEEVVKAQNFEIES